MRVCFIRGPQLQVDHRLATRGDLCVCVCVFVCVCVCVSMCRQLHVDNRLATRGVCVCIFLSRGTYLHVKHRLATRIPSCMSIIDSQLGCVCVCFIKVSLVECQPSTRN